MPSASSSTSPAAEPASPASEPASSSSGSAPATPSRSYRGRALRPLKLRKNADAHPELCRIAGCRRPVKTRGLCGADAERARDAGLLDSIGLPAMSRSESARIGGTVAGRGRRKAAAAKVARPDPEADTPLQVIRGLLGCDPDSFDGEVVEAVRRLVERDVLAGRGDGGTLRAGLRDLLGHPVTSTDAELIEAAREVKGERDRADVEIAALTEKVAPLRVALGVPDRALDGEVLAEAVRRVKATPPTAATAPQPATLDPVVRSAMALLIDHMADTPYPDKRVTTALRSLATGEVADGR